MPHLKRTHIYKVDRAKMSAVVTACNPIRRYVRGEAFEGDETAHGPIKVQADNRGQNFFFTDGGDELASTDIPEYILEHLRKDPLRSKGQTVEQVMRYCPICPQPHNCVASGIYEQHLLDHLKEAGIAKPVKEEAQPRAPRRRAGAKKAA